MNHPPATRRRHFLVGAAGAFAACALPQGAARAEVASASRSLALVHTHTHERIDLAYAQGDLYDGRALGALDRFLRDHYSGAVGTIDPQLYEMLHGVRLLLGTERPFEVISGYRAPATNQRLRAAGGGGVAKNSLHMQGRAIDVRLPGVPLKELRDAALALRGGGVGYYSGSQFVHLDTGRVRAW